MSSNNSTMAFRFSLLLLVLTCCILVADCRPRPKKLDCRIYVYAAECRGAAAKRDTRRFEESMEDKRLLLQEIADQAEIERRKTLLNSLIKKLTLPSSPSLSSPSSTGVDYDTGTDNYLH